MVSKMSLSAWSPSVPQHRQRWASVASHGQHPVLVLQESPVQCPVQTVVYAMSALTKSLTFLVVELRFLLVWVPTEVRGVRDPPEAGVTGSCELSNMSLGPTEKKQTLNYRAISLFLPLS